MRFAVVAALAAVLVPSLATGATRMYVGFQDDASFRFRPDRDYIFDRAKNSHATVIRSTIDWARAAPTRPARAANPFDPAYRLEDIDEFVRKAQARGIEAMLQIYGTPTWANGGAGRNRVPRRLTDLTAFSQAVSARYSGRYPGFPFVRFWGVWNEPNLNQFLSPQFDRKGKSVAPATYARLFAASYRGIKAGNSSALVGMGETSARGRDRRIRGLQDTHSPGKFFQLVAKAAPRLKFDAVAHHPYPTDPKQRPNQVVRWPNVSLRLFPRFERSLNTWFHRRSTPIWITEYGHETKPPDPKGISYALQASYLRQAIGIARGYPYVTMFIWFVLHDDQGDPWQSGLIAENGEVKPAFYTFAETVFPLDPRNIIYTVPSGRANPVVRISALEIASRSPPGSRVGVDARIYTGDSVVAHVFPEGILGRDGWVQVPLRFTPEGRRTYYAQIEANDIHGNRVRRLLTIVSR
ncbi:MAG: cellulase family glycosylhydrolase [Actinomycetota bacterium]|nr:cellulase family glycosylhydrolase [Actinomycetota bacterium]